MLRPIPAVRERQVRPRRFRRALPASTAFSWLAAGWQDFIHSPLQSLAYGLFLTLLSYAVLFALNAMGLLYLALPAISGFLILGPFLALGLYAKSQRRMEGKTISLGEMLLVRPAAGAQLAYAGLFLGLLVLLWLRAADLLYALFFGIVPFPGAEEAFINVFTTDRGIGLLIVGSLVGGIFAAFAFAVSLFAIPIMLAEPRDALTAMGKSFVMTVQNLNVTLVWGAIVAAGLAISVLTGLVALAIVFPVLGHGTWHVYRTIRLQEEVI